MMNRDTLYFRLSLIWLAVVVGCLVLVVSKARLSWRPSGSRPHLDQLRGASELITEGRQNKRLA
ncbi:hypothetical protein M2210_006380 [Bradyrhizobium elkanii]|nr:hypothetical protein [Bradyrhizobium elkanii]